jgi:hypothetical protein
MEMQPQIEQHLLKLPEEKRQLAMQLRDIIYSANSNLTESIKWNNLTYSNGKTNLIFIYTYPKVDYVNLGFLHAVELTDPKKLFEGTGKGMRHIKVRDEKNIPVAQIKKWVKEAVGLKSKVLQ